MCLCAAFGCVVASGDARGVRGAAVSANKSVRAYAEKRGGRLYVNDRQRFDDDVAARMPSDVPLEIVVRTVVDKHGFRQMQKYWHAVPVEILRKHPIVGGLQHMQMHYALLGECFGYTESHFGPVPIVASSSRMPKEMWVQLIDWVLTWAPSEYQIVIPEPNSDKAKGMVEEYHRAGEGDEVAA